MVQSRPVELRSEKLFLKTIDGGRIWQEFGMCAVVEIHRAVVSRWYYHQK